MLKNPCSLLTQPLTYSWKMKTEDIPHRMYTAASGTENFYPPAQSFLLLAKRKDAFSDLSLETGCQGPLSHLYTFELPTVFPDS